jgi:PAS domain S-box-containing protein
MSLGSGLGSRASEPGRIGERAALSKVTSGNVGEQGSDALSPRDLIGAVRARERFLEGILGSLESFVTVDEHWRLTFVNEAAAKLMHAVRDELLGDDLLDLMPPDAGGQASPLLRKAMADRSSVEFEIVSKVAGRQFQVKAYPLADGGLAVYLRDVSERRRAERALRESAQRLRFHLENTPLAVVEWDADFVVTLWAGEAEAMFGWPASETVGRPIMDLDLIHVDDIPIVERTMAKLIGGEHTQVVGSNRNVTRDGRVIDCTWYNSVLLDDEGHMSSVMSLVLDRTEHKEALEALRASEERQAFLLQLSDTLRPLDNAAAIEETADRLLGRYLGVDRCGFGEVDATGDQLAITDDWAAPGMRALARRHHADDFGQPLVEALGRSETIVIHDARTSELTQGAEVAATLDAIQAGAGIVHPLLRQGGLAGVMFVQTAGPRRWTDEEAALVAEVGERTWSAVERARAEAALRERAAEQATQTARNRIARDLHDSVTQSLFAANLKAEALALTLENDERAGEFIEQLQRLNRGALAQMRTLLIELRGADLGQIALRQLLRNVVESAESRAPVDVHLDVRGDATLPAELHTALYRVTQEALNNVVRHSGASTAQVDVELATDEVHLVVVDDGCGFEPGAQDPTHMGLKSMRERAQEAGAEFRLLSGRGKGTQVFLDWPGDS